MKRMYIEIEAEKVQLVLLETMLAKKVEQIDFDACHILIHDPL